MFRNEYTTDKFAAILWELALLIIFKPSIMLSITPPSTATKPGQLVTKF
jgi:hypothetical protein